jgi:hypothetical protein
MIYLASLVEGCAGRVLTPLHLCGGAQPAAL